MKLQEDYLDGGSGKLPHIPDNDSASVGLRIMNWGISYEVFKLKTSSKQSLTCMFLE